MSGFIRAFMGLALFVTVGLWAWLFLSSSAILINENTVENRIISAFGVECKYFTGISILSRLYLQDACPRILKITTNGIK